MLAHELLQTFFFSRTSLDLFETFKDKKSVEVGQNREIFFELRLIQRQMYHVCSVVQCDRHRLVAPIIIRASMGESEGG